MHGLPADDLASRPTRTPRVSAEDVMRFAKKYLALERLRIVVTGDAAVVRNDLEGLDLGPVQTAGEAPHP